MFYIKTKIANGKIVKTHITEENVFTCCPKCGRELPVDISEIFSDGVGDLYSTSIICCACTKKRRHIDGLTITSDGLALLSDVLCQSGYGEQVFDLFYKFNIEDIKELTPEDYELFADALSDLATVGCQ